MLASIEADDLSAEDVARDAPVLLVVHLPNVVREQRMVVGKNGLLEQRLKRTVPDFGREVGVGNLGNHPQQLPAPCEAASELDVSHVEMLPDDFHVLVDVMGR